MRGVPLDPSESPCVLVVEDDEDLAFMYRFRLEHDGFVVAHAADGVQALNVARHLRPSVICLDMYIPLLDGLTVLKELKADPKLTHIPVLVLSGLSEPELERQALKLGASRVVVKAEKSPGEVSAILLSLTRGDGVPQPG
jgi:two-component system alkaline phosphatase synthesis response regulator PhoP